MHARIIASYRGRGSRIGWGNWLMAVGRVRRGVYIVYPITTLETADIYILCHSYVVAQVVAQVAAQPCG